MLIDGKAIAFIPSSNLLSKKLSLNSSNLGALGGYTNRLIMNEKPRIRGTTPFVEEAAKRLRKNMTPAEAHLWLFLKGKKLAGLKFRRQHPVGNFILDFYCPAYKLVIEVDGEIHNYQINRDRARTSKLEEYGYKVLRFSNEQVLKDLPGVLAEIRQAVSPP